MLAASREQAARRAERNGPAGGGAPCGSRLRCARCDCFAKCPPAGVARYTVFERQAASRSLAPLREPRDPPRRVAQGFDRRAHTVEERQEEAGGRDETRDRRGNEGSPAASPRLSTPFADRSALAGTEPSRRAAIAGAAAGRRPQAAAANRSREPEPVVAARGGDRRRQPVRLAASTCPRDENPDAARRRGCGSGCRCRCGLRMRMPIRMPLPLRMRLRMQLPMALRYHSDAEAGGRPPGIGDPVGSSFLPRARLRVLLLAARPLRTPRPPAAKPRQFIRLRISGVAISCRRRTQKVGSSCQPTVRDSSKMVPNSFSE
jgi:hypothetical protein